MVGIDQPIPRLQEALSQARDNDVARIDLALRSEGVTGVHGEAEVGITSMIDTALGLSGRDAIRVDLNGVTSEDDVAWLMARGIARCELGAAAFSQMTLPEALRPISANQQFLHFAERAGTHVAELARSEQQVQGVGVRAVLDAMVNMYQRTTTPPLLWIDHLQAPSLMSRHPVDVDALLWNVRAMQQQLDAPIILSGHRTATPTAFGPSGAFHGDGQWVTLGRPGLDVWGTVGASLESAAPPPNWIKDMAAITHGHPATMLMAMAMYVAMQDLAPTALTLWQLMLSLDDGHTARAVQHARTLHRLGGHVLQQIARSVGPYEDAATDNRRKDINRAVKRLHEAGLITQPRPRAWELTNPLVAGRLRGQVPQSVAEAWPADAEELRKQRAAFRRRKLDEITHLSEELEGGYR